MALRGFGQVALLAAASPSAFAEGWPDISEPPSSGGGGAEHDAAVVVGIQDYVMDGVPDVPGARANAEAWYAWLSKTRGVPSTRIHLRLDAEGTDALIREAAQRAASQVGFGGTLWFVYIGHGAPAQDGSDGLLVGADASASATGIYSRSVARGELADILAEGEQARTVMVLDACFSGKSSSGDALVEGLQPLVPVSATVDDRVTMLTATQRDQFAGPLPGSARPAFSYLLLGAMRGWGDADGNGEVTAGEATLYARDVLLATVSGRTQEPALTGLGASWVLGIGQEAGPDLADMRLATGAAGAGSSVQVELGGDDVDLAQLAADAAAAEAVAKEAEQRRQATLMALAEERERQLGAAEDALLTKAAKDWAAVEPLMGSDSDSAREVMAAFVERYEDAKVTAADATGSYKREVEVAEVRAAKDWLKKGPAKEPAKKLARESTGQHPSRWMAITGAVAGAAAGGAFLWANSLRNEFLEAGARSRATELESQNHAATVGGGALGAIGGGLMLGALIRWEW